MVALCYKLTYKCYLCVTLCNFFRYFYSQLSKSYNYLRNLFFCLTVFTVHNFFQSVLTGCFFALFSSFLLSSLIQRNIYIYFFSILFSIYSSLYKSRIPHIYPMFHRIPSYSIVFHSYSIRIPSVIHRIPSVFQAIYRIPAYSIVVHSDQMQNQYITYSMFRSFADQR